MIRDSAFYARDSIRRDLLELFRHGVDTPLDEASFDRLAGRVFASQLERNAPYAAYALRRLGSPTDIPHWTRIPAVPTAAFKELALVGGDPARAEALFRTSGTTRGPERRGAHYVLDLSLYHASLVPTFAAFVLPDGSRPRMLSLLPPGAQQPDSSLGHMVDVVMRELGAPDSIAFGDVERGLDEAGLEAALQDATEKGAPPCLLGTTLAFVDWLDSAARRGVRFRLPEGSRLMDTGGFKGSTRVVEPETIRAEYHARLGIAPDHVVNEYGMTELLSQRYDVVLREGGIGEPRRKGGPPWLRTVAVDPDTLEPLSDGSVGLLRHVDLANLDSVVAVQTEDLGYVDRGAVILLGRAAGAAPRGCSIATELLLEAARGR